jgi:hypothetical protein|tara:strand:+ start:920 stop:1453 length:534 start_codon:yes stop_codon:yes gene_type:complete
MYFSNFPFIVYDSVGNGDFKIVTNLLKRVALRSKVRANTLVFDTYDVREGETPEILADKLYDDPELHWIILYVNNITDRYHQWPMSYAQFNSFLNDKYTNIDAVHHYEVLQTSGDTSIKIDIGTDTTGYSEADLTLITNREFEEERQDKLRQIRLLDFAYVGQFIEEFKSLMGESVL